MWKSQARRFGRAVGEKVVAYAKSQGWLATPEVEAQPHEQVKLPEPKPAQKAEKAEQADGVNRVSAPRAAP